MGLGPLHTISLSAAREQAALCRKLLFDGVNLRVHRDQKRAEDQLEQANQKTFKECATQYIEDNKAGWKMRNTPSNGLQPLKPMPTGLLVIWWLPK